MLAVGVYSPFNKVGFTFVSAISSSHQPTKIQSPSQLALGIAVGSVTIAPVDSSISQLPVPASKVTVYSVGGSGSTSAAYVTVIELRRTCAVSDDIV